MKRYVSINSTIVAALKPILPTVHGVYSGTAKTYATFMTYNSLKENQASGVHHALGIYGDIDVFSDSDMSGATSIIDAITTALEAAGIEVKDIRDDVFDGITHHVVIPFYKSIEE